MPRPRAAQPVSARGLTLIELLIVVAIIGVLAGLAVPMFSGTDEFRLRSAAAMVVADLDAARIDSIANADDPRVVVFDTATESYHLAPASATTTPLTNPADRQPWQVTFGSGSAYEFEGVGLRSVTAGGDSTLAYAAFGNLNESADAAIELEIDNLRVVISIDATTGEATVGDIQSN